MSIIGITEMALNLAINTCFGLSGSKWAEGNKPRQSNLMSSVIVFGVINFFIELFGGGTQPAAQHMGISQSDLDKSLNDLFQKIDDDLFNQFQISQMAPVMTMLDQFKLAFAEAQAAAKSYTGMPEEDAVLNKSWSAYYSSFQTEVTSTVPVTLEACKWVALECDPTDGSHVDRRFETLSLYMMAAGLYLNVCQFCLIIEWQEILDAASKPGSAYAVASNKYNTVDLPHWQIAHKKWQQQTSNQKKLQALNPHTTYALPKEPPMPMPPMPPPQCFDQLTKSVNVKAIIDHTQGFIAYADPIVKEMELALAKRNQLRSNLLGKVVNQPLTVPGFSFPLPGYSSFINNATGFIGTIKPDKMIDDQIIMEEGFMRAGLTQVEDARLQYVDADQVKANRDTLDGWSETLANYKPTSPSPST